MSQDPYHNPRASRQLARGSGDPLLTLQTLVELTSQSGRRGGLQHPRVTQDETNIYVVQKLIENDVLVAQTGCGALGSAKYGLLRPETALEKAGPEVTALISQSWEEKTGGKLEFVPDPEEMVRRALAHIDRKRAELGLTEHDPTRFGRSGEARVADCLSLPIEDRVRQLCGWAARF